MNTFDMLNAVNVNDYTEKKETDGGRTLLTYLSWPFAWAEVKKRFPEAQYTILKDADGLPYFSDPRTGIIVYTTVTIDGITHEMWLPVMDSNNKAMRFEQYEIQTKYKTITVKPATMFDINKTIMRCLVKNLAMFGLGLYIYAGEDLPEEEAAAKRAEDAPQTKEEIRKEIEKAKANPLNIDPNKPAPGQIKYMLEHFGPNELTKYRGTYGENLEGMTREQAVQMVTFLQKREERKAAAMA